MSVTGTCILNSKETTAVIQSMGKLFPEAKAELNYRNAFELLIAVILSAQTTDVGVNKVTPALFEAYPTPQLLMNASVEDIQEKIKTIGLYRNKSRFIKACSAKLVDEFDGDVPFTHKELESLPGVGRKTANVVLSVAFDQPAIAVDTHVERVSKRLGLVPENATVRQVEDILKSKLPIDMWSQAHHQLIFFGRYQCPARKHDHSVCIEKLNEHMTGFSLKECEK